MPFLVFLSSCSARKHKTLQEQKRKKRSHDGLLLQIIKNEKAFDDNQLGFSFMKSYEINH